MDGWRWSCLECVGVDVHTYTHHITPQTKRKTNAGNPYGKRRLTLALLETVASALHYNAPLTLQHLEARGATQQVRSSVLHLSG